MNDNQNQSDTISVESDANIPAINILTDPVASFNCSKCNCLIDVKGLKAFTKIECPECQAIEHVPARLGNFLLLKLLGTGGMGGVYYAKDESLGRSVAIKVMLQKLGNDPEFIETFRREAQAIAKLNHPNISQIYSFGQEKGQPYIVMELIVGKHVDEMMEEDGGISPALAVRICYEVAQGLSAADEAGIVHGDIKPENILLDKNGRAKIVDFGLATVAHAAAEKGIWGTPYYIAPEKIRRQKIDARADIYSLGATLYHILAGKPPFEGKTPIDVVKARLVNPPPDLKETCPDMPDIVVQIVTRMLATERTARYPTYKSLISDMLKAVNELKSSGLKTARLGGKQIRFKKKKNIKKTTPVVPDSSDKISVQKNNKKIVIHKNTANPVFNAQNSAKSKTFKKVEKSDPEPISNEVNNPIPKKVIKIVVIISLIALALIAVGTGSYFFVEHTKEIKRKRIEFFANKNAKEKSAELYNQIIENVEKVAKITPKVEDFETTITNAVFLITDQEFTFQSLSNTEETPEESEEVAEETEDAPNEAEKAAEEIEEAPNEAEEAEEVTEETSKEKTDKGDEEGEINEKEAASEEIEKKEDLKAEESNNDDSDAVKKEQEPAEDNSVLDPEELILKVSDLQDQNIPAINLKAHNAIINLRKLQAINLRMNQTHKNAKLANSTAQKTQKSKDSKKLETALQIMSKNCELYKASAFNLYRAIKDDYAEISEMVKTHKAKVEKQRKVDLECAKITEEQERLERERLAKAQLVKTETEQAKIEHDSMKTSAEFSNNEFSLIVKKLKKQKKEYQTASGRNALKVFIDRYQHMVIMRETIIKCVNENQFFWGWGHGSSARDITKASQTGFSIKDSSAVYPWKSVSIIQMLKFVDHYISDRKTPILDKRKMAIGAAVYCDEFDNEKAKSKSKSFLNNAISFGLRDSEAERLFEHDL